MSKMVMEGVVTDVELRKVQRRDGSGEMELYDVIVQDGSKWTAFEKDLAEKAWNLKGTPALLEVEVVQKGNYTNKNLKGVEAKVSNGFAPTLGAMEAQIGNGASTTATSFGETKTTAFQPSDSGSNPTYSDRVIWRQCATKVAAVLAKSELDFWANVDTLIRYYETGEKPNLFTPDATPQPTFESATVAGNSDDDIPF